MPRKSRKQQKTPENNSGSTNRGEKLTGFVVGIDFGTTFTSVAFAHSSSPNEIKVVQSWPNGSSSAEYVPTVVYYKNPKTRELFWGYGSPKGKEALHRLEWFKLLLQRDSFATGDKPTAQNSSPWLYPSRSKSKKSTKLSGDTPSPTGPFGGLCADSTSEAMPLLETAQKLRELGISAITVVTDFLACVRKTAVENIERTYGAKWVQGSKITFVLTVPAIWNDSAKNSMVSAAENSGFGKHRDNFHLVSEPEAAAAYTLKEMQANINIGDTYIVCDAGGGTVDLISYKVVNRSPLRLDETVSGDGGLCGSVYLDIGFKDYIRRALGNTVVGNMQSRSEKEMMRSWEEGVKMKFGNRCDELEVSVPGVADNEKTKVEANFHAIEPKEVEKIFDPVMKRIIELVGHQVQGVHNKGEKVAAILLVGGFGTSLYLLQQLKAAFNDIEVLQPPKPRNAIVCGALQHGLDGTIVTKRRSRRFYGCGSSGHYEEGKGLEEHTFWCPRAERYMVKEKLNWYIKRNEVIDKEKSISFPFLRRIPIPTTPGKEPDLLFNDMLLACDLDEPPEYNWQNPRAIHRICVMQSDLSSIPTSKFKRRINCDGQEYYQVYYHMRITIADELLSFEMVFDGKPEGSVTARFNELEEKN